ncbi:Aldehyde oxidase [Rhynchospora pubera]|uniref:Aldehyde oxidase n=1 Tax=Rhynchospora pubera TaxID=906938 RepID=A0AAV8HDM8_9POAL|nr:Aldehyde oxidase [Rhynchospora pubera]
MDCNIDMVMVGGRHPINVRYDVGFKSDGKITALNLRVLFNSGISKDFIENIKKYNWCNLSFDIKLCKTNLTSKSSMWAPGGVQGSFVAEAIIEHVASVLFLETNTVRRKNLHSYESLILFYDFVNEEAKNYTLPTIFDKLTATLDYKNRAETVRKFNCTNKWKKRGISSVPIVYMVHCYPVPGGVSIFNDASIAVEVGGIELGQGLWTKVKQMTAFCLEKLCENESLLERVRIIQTDTLSMLQGGKLEGAAHQNRAVLACDILIGRLIPLKHSLQEENGAVSWVSLISKAVQHSINLSASSFFVPSLNNARYLNYGAATSEVKIDILSGETTILRSDISYDCGQN